MYFINRKFILCLFHDDKVFTSLHTLIMQFVHGGKIPWMDKDITPDFVIAKQEPIQLRLKSPGRC